MKQTSQIGKHRAAVRTVTPLTILARNTGEAMGSMGRKSVVALSATSMLATLIAVPSAHADAPGSGESAVGVDLGSLTSTLRNTLDQSPEILVTEDDFEIESAVVSVTPGTRGRSVQRTSYSRPIQRVNPMSIEAEGKARDLIDFALQFQGIPYVHGGKNPDQGFDCSGFTSYVFSHIGIKLSASSAAQKHVGVRVSREDAQPGDLIWSPGHVAIYLGNGQQIDAPRKGKTIQVRGIWQRNPMFLRLINN